MKVRGKNLDITSALACGLPGLGAGFFLGLYLGRLLSRREIERRIASETEEIRRHYRARAESAERELGKVRRAYHDLSATRALARDYQNKRETAMGIPDDSDPDPGEIHLVEDTEINPGHGGRPLSASENPGKNGPANGNPVPGQGDPLEGMPGYGEDADDDPGAEDDDDVPPPELISEDRDDIHVISRDEFEDEYPHFRKISVTWYEADHTLADDKGVPIRNVSSVAGTRLHSRFGEKSGDPEIIFIRNHPLESDFEVTRDSRSYSEVVLNYGRPE